jgi:two-component system, OmpR family, heavy metal sensor histidine kinase CusS
VRIEVGCEPPAGLRLRVVNTGCAIPPAQIHRVFDRFWRGDAARSATGVHCGIGLSLCQKLVALLGGNVTAEATAAGVFAITVRLADCQVG